MKLCLTILSIALMFYTTQACQSGNCYPICAAEKKDPTNQTTLNKKTVLEKFNENFEKDDEKFVFVHDGKCVLPDTCPVTYKTSICAVMEMGACGPPKTYANLCEFNKYNSAHPDAEYEYYHDEDCNDVSAMIADDCDCLECEKEEMKPVCGVPADPCCGPLKTFRNKCMLEQHNCLDTQNESQYWYFHEGECYTDHPAK